MLYYLFEYLDKTYDIPGAGLFRFLSFRAILGKNYLSKTRMKMRRNGPDKAGFHKKAASPKERGHIVDN